MAGKFKYLVGVLALTTVLVGCGEKEPTIQQGADTSASSEVIDPSADLQAAKEAYVGNEPSSQVEGFDFEANKNTDQAEPQPEDTRDISTVLSDAAEAAKEQPQ